MDTIGPSTHYYGSRTMMLASLFEPNAPSKFLSVALRNGVALFSMTAAAASAQQPFSEEAAARGVNYLVAASGTSGQGVALCDLDRDGDPDLVVLGRIDGVIGVYENDGTGRFTDRTSTSGLAPIPFNSASGVVAADYDGDGWVDLYFSNANTPDRLVRNLGSFHFADVTAGSGLGDFGFGVGCTWADYDGDGYLDLYVANNTKLSNPSPNKLYHNQGDGTFVVDSAGLNNEDLPAWQAVFLDYDRDGDPDLYVSNDKGLPGTRQHNYLWKNVGGTFVDATDESGTHAYVDSMGIAVGDLDGNGFPDIYCTNIGPNPLFMNVDGTTFVESSTAANVTSDSVGWGTLFLDYDQDARLDIFACNHNDDDRLYSFRDGWPAVDRAGAMQVRDANLSYCVATGDIDGDGDLDIVHSAVYDPIRIYVNQTVSHFSWIKVLLVGVAPNTKAVGAWVDITTAYTKPGQQVLAGIGYKSSSPFTLHFGLGSSTSISELRVTWPNGKATVLQDVAVNRTIVISQERGILPATLGQY